MQYPTQVNVITVYTMIHINGIIFLSLHSLLIKSIFEDKFPLRFVINVNVFKTTSAYSHIKLQINLLKVLL